MQSAYLVHMGLTGHNVLIGQKRSKVVNIIDTLRKYNVLDYT
jgi:F0F1-type ATP synthase alpha subunit